MAELGAFDNMKVELDHGEIVRMTPPHLPHGMLQAQLIAKLYAMLQGTGLTVLGEVGVNLGENTIRAFDAAVLEIGAKPDKLLVPEQVRLAIEISYTTLDFDLGPKRRDYARAGIANYWSVDVAARVTRIMSEPQNENYPEPELVRFGVAMLIPGTDISIVLE